MLLLELLMLMLCAVALAQPATRPNGQPFPGREQALDYQEAQL